MVKPHPVTTKDANYNCYSWWIYNSKENEWAMREKHGNAMFLVVEARQWREKRITRKKYKKQSNCETTKGWMLKSNDRNRVSSKITTRWNYFPHCESTSWKVAVFNGKASQGKWKFWYCFAFSIKKQNITKKLSIEVWSNNSLVLKSLWPFKLFLNGFPDIANGRLT